MNRPAVRALRALRGFGTAAPRWLAAPLPGGLVVLALLAGAPAAAATPEPAVQRQVLEDEQVRIEELRVRGVNQRLVVRPKVAGVAAYEILPEEPGRDTTSSRGAAGQRVWRLLSF